MKNATISLLFVLMSFGMNFYSHADELFTHEKFFTPSDNSSVKNLSGNEIGGEIIVQGNLFSSPCILDSDEIFIPTIPLNSGKSLPIILKLRGCGDGDEQRPNSTKSGGILIAYSALVSDGSKNIIGKLHSRVIETGNITIYGGKGNIVWQLNQFQQDIISRSLTNKKGILRLRLDYE
ncbi:pilus-assembly fibrillin subunit [Providencia alcalifaciens]|uniref:pilus-assembly fibrillin subunit n=1 Tax=Providencia alcalifaciens TaxID=126385 RepID=UPI00056D1523|nr:pilus-assembly fibrillin subunit [Providencia alcalifaciens]